MRAGSAGRALSRIISRITLYTGDGCIYYVPGCRAIDSGRSRRSETDDNGGANSVNSRVWRLWIGFRHPDVIYTDTIRVRTTRIRLAAIRVVHSLPAARSQEMDGEREMRKLFLIFLIISSAATLYYISKNISRWYITEFVARISAAIISSTQERFERSFLRKSDCNLNLILILFNSDYLSIE